MKYGKKIFTTILTTALAAGMAFAAAPDFSMKLNGAIGANNLRKNPIIVEVPGLSDNTSIDFDFALNGNFGKDTNDSSVGYSSGIKVDVDSLYRNSDSSHGYTSPDSRYSNNYTKIQKMIDWYEANKHYYGLPDNPFPTKKWPEGKYGEGRHEYRFIKGTAVEDVNNVQWSSTAWAAAEALYHDVKSHIEDAINALYSEAPYNIPVGNTVKQDEYATWSEAKRQMAILKMEAVNSFKNLSSSRARRPAASGYADFTNIASMFDIRLDIAASRLSAGTLISSERTGQHEYGSSLSFSTTENLVPGLNAGITLGVAGGVAQRPEQWDTQCVDYNPGKYAELGIKLNADYAYEFSDIDLSLSTGLDFVMPDLMVAPLNNAAAIRLGLNWKDGETMEVSNDFEFVYALTKDRYDMNDQLSFAYALKNEILFNGFGAEIKFDTAFKGPNFASKYRNQVEDRFSGRSISADFDAANISSALLLNFHASWNTAVLFNTEIAAVTAGVDALIYQGAAVGLGWDAAVAVNLVDYVNHDFILETGINYYRNNAVPTFPDYPETGSFMDSTTFTAGVSYEPAENYLIGLTFKDAPSTSVRYTQRLTSVEATFRVSY